MKHIGKAQGTVIKWDAEKKFGFVKIEGVFNGREELERLTYSGDAFIYHTELIMEGYRKLIAGQKVEFELFRTDKGYSGKEVQVIGDAFDPEGEINGNC